MVMIGSQQVNNGSSCTAKVITRYLLFEKFMTEFHKIFRDINPLKSYLKLGRTVLDT